MNILKMIYNEIEQEIEDSGICVDYESNEEIIARLIERIAHKHIPSPSPRPFRCTGEFDCDCCDRDCK